MGNSWHRQSWPGFRLDETVDNKTRYMSFKLNFHGKKCRNQSYMCFAVNFLKPKVKLVALKLRGSL